MKNHKTKIELTGYSKNKINTMNGLLSTSNDPAFNLATEEFLLRHTTKNLFFLYVNRPSIIVGKHQNTLGEINYQFVNDQQIPVYRRLSGGGTVYHDENNLNFCFIETGKKTDLVNFKRYSEPILHALKQMGINATFGKRHDILIDGKKVSGNASHVYKSRVMHHGTLLYSSKLDVLNNALKTNPLLIKDKAVKSVRSEVTNISNHLDYRLSFQDFVKTIFNHLIKHYHNAPTLSLTKEETKQIQALSDKKYNTWAWNYGYSPNYELNKRIKLDNGTRIHNQIKIEKGLITTCQIKCSDQNLKPIFEKLSSDMIGVQIHRNYIKDILYSYKTDFNSKHAENQILDSFFA